MDAYLIGLYPNRAVHKTAPDTDPSLINAWKRSNGFFVCERRNLGLSQAECQRMRTAALRVTRTVVRAVNYKWTTNAWQRAQLCATCREFPR